MTTILAFAFVIGVLVFVHELGHYLAARHVGVRVLKFSIGFGPRVAGVVRGGTDYCLSAVPLGGYVKMAGENADETRQGQPDEFMSRSKWERFYILIMGPAMNLVLAVVVLAVVLARGADVPAFQDQPALVGAVEKGSAAERGGVRPGDVILRVADTAVPTWEQFYLHISARPDRETPLLVRRDGATLALTVVPTPETKYRVGDIGVYPNVHPRIRSVSPGGPAAGAGLQVGDVVLAVNGETISFARQLSEAIASRPDQPITMALQRGADRLDVRVTPKRTGDRGLIGIGINDETRRVEPGPLEALRLSVVRNAETAALIARTLVGLFTGDTSPRQLMGPVGIAQLSGESAEDGWMSLLTLLASISLNLGLLNLLPIPVLDGGHIAIMALEGVARRNFSLRVKERMLLAGFVLLMLLMVTVIYNDLARVGWVETLMFWR